MFNVKEFEISLMRCNKTKEDIARLLNINIATLYRKTNGQSDFYRHEIQKIADFLSLTSDELNVIFFESKLA